MKPEIVAKFVFFIGRNTPFDLETRKDKDEYYFVIDTEINTFEIRTFNDMFEFIEGHFELMEIYKE